MYLSPSAASLLPPGTVHWPKGTYQRKPSLRTQTSQQPAPLQKGLHCQPLETHEQPATCVSLHRECHCKPYSLTQSPFPTDDFKSSRNFYCNGGHQAAQARVLRRMKNRVVEAQGSPLFSRAPPLWVSQHYHTLTASQLPARRSVPQELLARMVSLVEEHRPIQQPSLSAPHWPLLIRCGACLLYSRRTLHNKWGQAGCSCQGAV